MIEEFQAHVENFRNLILTPSFRSHRKEFIVLVEQLVEEFQQLEVPVEHLQYAHQILSEVINIYEVKLIGDREVPLPRCDD